MNNAINIEIQSFAIIKLVLQWIVDAEDTKKARRSMQP